VNNWSKSNLLYIEKLNKGVGGNNSFVI